MLLYYNAATASASDRPGLQKSVDLCSEFTVTDWHFLRLAFCSCVAEKHSLTLDHL